ncbi:DnaJ domain-containing protein [Fusibacter bizertensis]
MNPSEIKKKIRQLKRQEIEIRTEYGQLNRNMSTLVWDSYFSEKSAKYDVAMLSRMTSEERKAVFDDFFFSVYIQYYRENGIPISNLSDPKILSVLGLLQGATLAEVKERFRALAHEHHPDKGGDPEVFMKLLEAYEKIKEA